MKYTSLRRERLGFDPNGSMCAHHDRRIDVTFRLVQVQLQQRQLCLVCEAPHGVVHFSRRLKSRMFPVGVSPRRREAEGGARDSWSLRRLRYEVCADKNDDAHVHLYRAAESAMPRMLGRKSIGDHLSQLGARADLPADFQDFPRHLSNLCAALDLDRYERSVVTGSSHHATRNPTLLPTSPRQRHSGPRRSSREADTQPRDVVETGTPIARRQLIRSA